MMSATDSSSSSSRLRQTPAGKLVGARLASQITVDSLRPAVRSFVEDYARVLCPDRIHVCDGTEGENQELLKYLQGIGRIRKLPKYDNW